MWCDTMSCFVPCDKVYCYTDRVQVRVNLYCSPFMDIVTANGVPIFGYVDVANDKCLRIDNLADSACQLASPVTQNLYCKIKSNPALSTFTAAIDKVGKKLVKYLKNCQTTATVFAPSNDAFVNLAKELNITVEELLDSENLKELVYNHLLSRVVFTEAFVLDKATNVLSCAKQCLKVCKTTNKCCEKRLYISSKGTNRSMMISADKLATNGVLDIVNKVLVP